MTRSGFQYVTPSLLIRQLCLAFNMLRLKVIPLALGKGITREFVTATTYDLQCLPTFCHYRSYVVAYFWDNPNSGLHTGAVDNIIKELMEWPNPFHPIKVISQEPDIHLYKSRTQTVEPATKSWVPDQTISGARSENKKTTVEIRSWRCTNHVVGEDLNPNGDCGPLMSYEDSWLGTIRMVWICKIRIGIIRKRIKVQVGR